MRIPFGWLTILFLAGCTRPARHHARVAPPGDAPFTAASGAAPTPVPPSSTAAGAATYRAVEDAAALSAATGTAALPAREAFRPRPLSANGSEDKAASGTAFTLRTKNPARVRQPRQEKPDPDPPARARLNRLSLLSVLAGVTIGVLLLILAAVPSLLPWMVPLWLLLGLAAIILGVRGANTLKARGEKGSFLSFIGILLGGIGILLALAVGIAALLNSLLPG